MIAPFADEGDDFHVGMGMRRETRIRCDLVVVPDAQVAVAHVGGIVVVAEGEVVLRLEPAVIRAAEFVEGPKFESWNCSFLSASGAEAAIDV